MKYQIIYILVGSMTLIINIVLLAAYLKLNFFISPKKTVTDIPKESESKKTDQNVVDPSDNTVDFDGDE
jgi:hypothetical protein